MFWTFLDQFWDLILPTSVGGAEYTTTWFQNIGFAVAGALGGFFDAIFHNLNDVFVFISWFFINLKNIFLSLLAPIAYFFNTLRFFFTTAFGTPPPPEATFTFTQEVLDIFQAIPNWAIFSSVIGAIIMFVIGISGLKLLLKT